jgi:hypothetical protein
MNYPLKMPIEKHLFQDVFGVDGWFVEFQADISMNPHYIPMVPI